MMFRVYVIFGNVLTNSSMFSCKLRCHFEENHPEEKYKMSIFFKRNTIKFPIQLI